MSLTLVSAQCGCTGQHASANNAAVHNGGAPPLMSPAEGYRLSGPLRTHIAVKPQFQRRSHRLPILAVFLRKAPDFCAFALTGDECRNELHCVDCLPPHLRHTCLPNVYEQVPQQGDGLPLSLVLQGDRTGRRPNRVNRLLHRGAAVAPVTPPRKERLKIPLMLVERALRQRWPRFHRSLELRQGSWLETTPAWQEDAILVPKRERWKRLSEGSRFWL